MEGCGEGAGLPPISGDGVHAAGPAEPPEVEGYEILGPLGAGGMGTVWRAVQKSTRREVALKVLGRGAFASERARRRFEREVELAARLEHPHIARVYDSGIYHGLYFYAMEFVDGPPLDEYVKNSALGRTETLRLIEAVCRAVQHAHQRGVLHRDLKPSNILVTSDGMPHVLDFGLAKALIEDDDLAISEGGEVLGTPAYMPPEQAIGRSGQVDTRSDVYSLGVVLYRLLTGGLPHDTSGARHEVLRRIAEDEVRRPREVARNLDRELEAILLNALAHDPDRRYASAGALADDIGRYLGGEPLMARPPTTLYFLRKRLLKHRAAIGMAALAALALVGMAIGSYVRVAHERSLALSARDEARDAAAKTTAMLGLFDEALASIDPDESQGRQVTVQDVLDKASRQVTAAFAGQPILEADVRCSLGKRYLVLRNYEAARAHFSSAVELRRRSLEDYHANTLDAMRALADALRLQGETAGAVSLYREVLQACRHLRGDDEAATLEVTSGLAETLADQEKYAEAEALRKEVVATSRRVLGEEHPSTLAFTADLANLLWHLGRRSEAEPLYRHVVEVRLRVLGEEHFDALSALDGLAGALWGQGKTAGAMPLYRRVAELRRKTLGEDHPLTLASISRLANALSDLGKQDEAAILHQEELELRQRASRQDLVGTLASMNELANDLYVQGKYRDAEELHRGILRIQQRTLGEEHAETLVSKSNLANDLFWQGKYQEAERLHREVLDVRRRELGESHPSTLLCLSNLARTLLRQRKCAEAEVLFREVFDSRQSIIGQSPREALWAVEGLAACLDARGKKDEAEAILKEREVILGHLRGQKRGPYPIPQAASDSNR